MKSFIAIVLGFIIVLAGIGFFAMAPVVVEEAVPIEDAITSATPAESGPEDIDPLADTSDPGHAKLVERFRQSSTSEFERRVLEDGVVTPEEYTEAVDLYVACVADRGYTVRVKPNPLVPGSNSYEIDMRTDAATPNPLPNQVEMDVIEHITAECADGTTMRIEALYNEQLTNPDGEDYPTIVLRCFEETGVVTPGELTRDDLAKQIFSPHGIEAANRGDVQAIACVVNPAQTGLEDGLPELTTGPEVAPSATPD